MVSPISVEIFIWVMLKIVSKKAGDLNLLLVFAQPSGNDLAMMHSQDVKNEKHLLADVFYQAGHELDKEGRGHGFSIQHESDFAGIGDRRDHIDTAFLSFEPNYRWLPFGYESLGVVT